MKKDVFSYNQGNQDFYSTVFSFKEINNNSMISIYSRNHRLGYQRGLDEGHLKKIIKSLKNNEEPISPTSILLGIDQENIRIESKENNCSSLTFTEINNNPLFRIIDGQHRIKAIEQHIKNLRNNNDIKELKKFEEYEFSVIIMPISNKNRIKEVKVFQSINAKAKPLKTDLTRLALIRYEEMEKITEIDYDKHLAHRVIFSLNDNNEYEENNTSKYKNSELINVWVNAIKVDVNNDDEFGVVSYSAFLKSIEQICSFYTQDLKKELKNKKLVNKSYKILDDRLNSLSNKLTFQLFIPIWEVVNKKWEGCFRMNNLMLEDEMYFDEDYYIQKNMGIRPLHNILLNIITNDNYMDFKKIINEFIIIINHSNLTSEDWKKGGKFKGLSSEAGFKHIESIINNKI